MMRNNGLLAPLASFRAVPLPRLAVAHLLATR